MKCASEIVEIRSNVNATYEIERKAKLLAKYLQACTNSITLCEGLISEKLEEAANIHGEQTVSISIPIYVYYDELKNKVFQLVIEHKNAYANGDSSWERDGDEYSYAALVEHLAQFCYEATISKDALVYKCWGCGNRHYDGLVIKTAPICH